MGRVRIIRTEIELVEVIEDVTEDLNNYHNKGGNMEKYVNKAANDILSLVSDPSSAGSNRVGLRSDEGEEMEYFVTLPVWEAVVSMARKGGLEYKVRS